MGLFNIFKKDREKIRIFWVTDSGIDIPSGEKKPNHILPFRLVGKNFSLMDNIDVSPERLDELLKKHRKELRSSEPPKEDFQATYDAALQIYDFVVAITVSKHLSRTFFSASSAAREFPGRVLIFDSNSVSVGEGAFYSLLRTHTEQVASRLTFSRKKPEQSLKQLKKELIGFRPRVKTYIHSRSSLHLRKFGNLGIVESKLVKLSGFLPLYQTSPESPPKLIGIFPSKESMFKKLEEMITADIATFEKPEIWLSESGKIKIGGFVETLAEKTEHLKRAPVRKTSPGVVVRFVAGEEFFAISVFDRVFKIKMGRNP